MDDPLISNNLGEFLNQIQGGLLQGSASSGMYAPKGSILITSNDPEVKRLATLIWNICFFKTVKEYELNRCIIACLSNTIFMFFIAESKDECSN